MGFFSGKSSAEKLLDAAWSGEVEKARAALDSGADCDCVDAGGQTPLLQAASVGHAAVVQLLLERGANKDAKNAGGWTPLRYAARNGNFDCVRVLLNHGADMEAKDKNGNTPLHWAAMNGRLECARLLVELGADKDAKTNNGTTPLQKIQDRSEDDSDTRAAKAALRLLLGNPSALRSSSGGATVQAAPAVAAAQREADAEAADAQTVNETTACKRWSFTIADAASGSGAAGVVRALPPPPPPRSSASADSAVQAAAAAAKQETATEAARKAAEAVALAARPSHYDAEAMPSELSLSQHGPAVVKQLGLPAVAAAACTNREADRAEEVAAAAAERARRLAEAEAATAVAAAQQQAEMASAKAREEADLRKAAEARAAALEREKAALLAAAEAARKAAADAAALAASVPADIADWLAALELSQHASRLVADHEWQRLGNARFISEAELRASGLGKLDAKRFLHEAAKLDGGDAKPAQPGVRVRVRALVVGINAYAPPLKQLDNAVADAAAVHAALNKLTGAASTLLTDCSKTGFEQALKDFRDGTGMCSKGRGMRVDAAPASAAATPTAERTLGVVFFAGHGLQVNGRNYLVPSDFRVPPRNAKLEVMLGDTADACVSLDRVEAVLRDAGVFAGSVLLDCCRDVPDFLQELGATRSSTGGTRALPAGMSDARPSLADLMVTFATGPGTEALDRSTRIPGHSPFTAALLKAFAEPRRLLELTPFLTDEVVADSGGKQRPHVGGSYGMEAGNLLLG